MSAFRVTFRPDGRSVEVPEGTSIAEAARLAKVPIVLPCDGQGTCGRCRVILPDRGSVLACQEVITEETTIDVPVTTRPDGTAIHIDCSIVPAAQHDASVNPLVFGVTGASSEDGQPESLSFAESDVSPGALGLAVDIGTSTIAAELVDLDTGMILARAGKANAQAAYGAEVTRRIEHAEDRGTEPLAEAVIGDLGMLIEETTSSTHTRPDQIQTMIVAGNTAMMHFLYRIDPSPIRLAPHAPRVETPTPVRAARLGIPGDPDGVVCSLPWIGGWVGGDITAGILATGMHCDERLTLLIDIGTNGEIVLGNRDWRVACAASAGPAFEGCGIRNGMSAGQGAIDRVRVAQDGKLLVETIGDTAPQGICGTGLISAVAGLFCAGVLDRAGRINARRADDVDGESGIVLVSPSESATGQTIAVVQRDIDSVLRAKAALFAGVKSLVELMDLSFGAIERWIICGGFGSRLDPADAIALGMIADVDPEHVEFAGNTSLRGARQALLHRSAWEEAQQIARSTTCVELIDQPNYFEEFTSAKFIPHTDLSLFPSAQLHGNGIDTAVGQIEEGAT